MVEAEKQHTGEKVARAAGLAREYLVTEELNCAESSFWAVMDALDLPMDETLRRVATPFGGGLGDSRLVCGALIGAVMAVGAVLGRTELDTPRKLVAYERTRRIVEGFVAEVGSDACRVLNPEGFDRLDLRLYCVRFVALAAQLAVGALLVGDPEVKRATFARGEGVSNR